MLHESSSDTLTLDDFVTGEKIATKPVVCPANNAGLISVLRNFQTVMQIVFSDCFETCLGAFIKDLEGSHRPMELVAADFLRFSVEQVLRDFFRVVRSVKSTAISAGSVSNPTECAQYLSGRFLELAGNLSTYSARVVDEQFFRVKLSRPARVSLCVSLQQGVAEQTRTCAYDNACVTVEQHFHSILNTGTARPLPASLDYAQHHHHTEGVPTAHFCS